MPRSENGIIGSMRACLLAGLAGLLLLSQSAHAQEGVFDMGVLGMNGAIDQATQQARRQAQARGSGTGTATLASRLAQSFARQTARIDRVPVRAVSASYVPSANVRERLAGIMGDAAARDGKAKGEEMRRVVLSQKALREYERIAPGLGYRPNDAIDAYAFYLLAQWGVANDYRRDVTRAQAASVRRQAANAYAEIAGQLGTNALRQEFAEMLAVQGAIMAGVHEAAVRTGDEAAVAKYAALARRGGKVAFAFDPAMIELTDEGFHRKEANRSD